METGTLRLEKRTRDTEAYLAVTGAKEGVRNLVIPEAVQDMPVREISAHAFAGHETLRFVKLPDQTDTIGAFAFHNCKALARVEMCDGVKTCGDGAIRQCTALSDVSFTVKHNNYEAAIRMLSDCDNTLTVTFVYPDGTARLTFPGFVYDFTENTMARTIQFNIEGSGMAFRECISRAGADFGSYDRLFSRAKLDNISVITQVVLNRLACPYALGAQARENYETYLKENAKAVLETLVRQNDLQGVRILAAMRERELLNREALGHALALASKKGLVEMAALLADCMAARPTRPHHNMLTL